MMMNYYKMFLDKIKRNEKPIFISVFSILVVFRIWIITGIPKLLVYGPHDDLFFAKAAHYIIHGQWMGPYNQMALIKGPFYPIFMVVSFFTGLPLYLNENIFYCGACIILFFASIRLIENRWSRLLLLVLLLYVPSSLPESMTIGVRREFVYFSLSLYVVAFSIGLFLNLDNRLPAFIFWSVGLGFSMGAFMITREEGVWIYPILFLLLLVCFFILWMGRADRKLVRSIIIILPILIWQIPSIIVSYLNYSHYGFWGITEQLDPDFNRVLNTLGRIETDDAWHPAIQIPQAARVEAYRASPLLNEMKDSIENAVVNWNVHDDASMATKPDWYLNKYGNGGREIGSHFMWLFRDVVANQGYYVNGKSSHVFYLQLADQLESACNEGNLKCSSPKNIPVIGGVNQRHFPIILRMFYEGLNHILKLDFVRMVSLDIRTWPVWVEGYDQFARYFEEFIYNSINSPGIYPDTGQYIVNGEVDIRLRVLQSKEILLKIILRVYTILTQPVFIVCFVMWIVLVFMSVLNKKWRKSQGRFLIISSFVLGLFFSRLITLVVVDATTSISGLFFYSASSYLFLYIFSFLMLYWILKQSIYLIYRKQVL